MDVRITEMFREIWLTVRGLEPIIILLDGAFLDDRGKVRILVSFFGRETPVELDFLQVEKL